MIVKIGQYLIDINKVVFIDHYKDTGYSISFTNGKGLLISEDEFSYKTFVQLWKEAKGIHNDHIPNIKE